MLNSFARFQLLSGPTPIERLTRLEQILGDALGGARLFAKRDDLMGVGGGGNKLRKLEFLVGAALANGCDTFLTTGGLQSNHARLSAAACARAGLACEVVLTRVVPRDDVEYRRNGNVLLDRLFGATVHELPGDVNAFEFAQQRARELRARLGATLMSSDQEAPRPSALLAMSHVHSRSVNKRPSSVRLAMSSFRMAVRGRTPVWLPASPRLDVIPCGWSLLRSSRTLRQLMRGLTTSRAKH